MKKLFLSLLLCTTLILSGCSAKQISNIPSDTPMEKSANDYNTANFNSDEVAYEDGGDDTQASDSDIKSESETDASGSDLSGSDQEDSKKNQKLVYTCDLNIESLEYDKTVSSVKDQIKKYKGIIQEENESDSNSYWYNSSKSTGTKHLYMVIRIPSDSYEAFLNDINGDGKIVSKNMRVDNITKHYSEIETTIQSLQTQEKRLLEMMDQAKTIEDMITVETRLTEVQNELAQYKNSLASLDMDVDYSTINLSIDEVVKYDAPSSTFYERLISTLEESKSTFLSFLENSLFTIILLGPVLLVILIVLIVLIKIIKAIRGRNRNQRKKSEKKLPPFRGRNRKSTQDETSAEKTSMKETSMKETSMDESSAKESSNDTSK